MTFVITQPCVDVQDQSCVEVCPVDCIHFEAGEDRMLYIEPEVCIDCGACEPACPVSAIFAEADLPEDQAHFLEINTLWFEDPAAARAMVGGGAAPAPAAAPAAEEPASEAEPAEEPAEAPAAEAEAAPVPVAAGTQVEAVEEHAHHDGPAVSQYGQPSPIGVAALAGMLVMLVGVWLAPGDPVNGGTPIIGGIIDIIPRLGIFRNLQGPPELGVVLILPALLFLLVFIVQQARELRGFDAKRERVIAGWREAGVPWRRSEESRSHELEATINQLANDRFPFPDEAHPDYRTYVNVPEPQLALEFTAGGASRSQVFPDIVVVEHPRNRPIMVAQVETKETVTRRQAELVWAQLENDDAPLYIYVPSGFAARARDYAMAAGIEHARIRTWRRQPGGMLVREL
ncbi:MAG: ferredoxin family protein [Chloroflexi bacterium]|nr:ferredoxin family protein [Chloroflexota bacterium]